MENTFSGGGIHQADKVLVAAGYKEPIDKDDKKEGSVGDSGIDKMIEGNEKPATTTDSTSAIAHSPAVVHAARGGGFLRPRFHRLHVLPARAEG